MRMGRSFIAYVREHRSGLTLWLALSVLVVMYYLHSDYLVWMVGVYCYMELVHIRMILQRNEIGWNAWASKSTKQS